MLFYVLFRLIIHAKRKTIMQHAKKFFDLL